METEACKERLRQILKQDGLVYASETQKVLDYSGNPIAWIYYHWNISLDAEGARLSAACILEKLKDFKSTQLAGYGFTSIPLVTACVMAGEGKYQGLAIRDKPETHGACRQIEGKPDRSRPVVVIDDSIASGASLRKAITILESEGFQVEGCVCLIDFPYRGGTQWARAQGYKVETVLGIWEDLEAPMPKHLPHYEREVPTYDPGYRLPDNDSPAAAARRTIEHYLRTWKVPLGPRHFDKEYDARGGVFVSIRTLDTDQRIARNGFYIIDPAESDIYRDIVLAAWRTVHLHYPVISQYGLDSLKIGVTLMGKQEEILPRSLDFLNYGIAIRSRIRTNKLGGALPNTQFFTSEIEQYHHALFTNTGLAEVEPHTLYRHRVVKSVEANHGWHPFGFSPNDQRLEEDLRTLPDLLARLMNFLEKAEPLTAIELPPALTALKPDGICICLYHKGLVGKGLSLTGDLSHKLTTALQAAWQDPIRRFGRKGIPAHQLSIVVSFLQQKELFPCTPLQQVSHKLRLGKDAVWVEKGNTSGLMPAFIPFQYGWDKEKLAFTLIRELGISAEQCNWKTLESSSWVIRGGDSIALPLHNGYISNAPTTKSTAGIRKLIRGMATHIVGQIGENGPLPAYSYSPAAHDLQTKGTTMRTILTLQALWEAGDILGNAEFKSIAGKGLSYFCDSIVTEGNRFGFSVPELDDFAGAESLLMIALVRSGNVSFLSKPKLRSILKKMISYLHADGCIIAGKKGTSLHADHNIFPGIVLTALALYFLETGDTPPVPMPSFREQFDWNRRRFELAHPWGMVWWQMQCWAPIFRLTGEREYAGFVFDIADWAMDRQLDLNGAFLVDYKKSGPDFSTACVLEGIADAWLLAADLGDRQRADRLEASWRKGLEFIEQLVVREEDGFWMPAPEYAVGGVRESLHSSFMRIDYTAHAMLALIKGLRKLDQPIQAINSARSPAV